MELVKLTEDVSKNYSTDSSGVETVNNATYKIMSDATTNATQIGDATVKASELNVHLYGIAGKVVTDMESELTKMIAAWL